MQKHTYAQQILKKNNIKIFSSGNEILKYTEDVFPIDKNLTTDYTLHRHISTNTKKEIVTLTYEDLLRKGYQISKKRAKSKFFLGQHMEYYLIRNTSGISSLGVIPPEHRIEFNVVENWIRLVGRNSSGRKMFLGTISRKKREKRELEIEDYMNEFENYLQEISPFTYMEEEQKINIPEIPILLTDDGKIVCLPLTKNNPTIGIFGKKGMGKTLLLHRIADCVYHKWHKRVFLGNDIVSFQTRSWSLPWDKNKHQFFIKWLEKIGEPSLPLPCVYLTPNQNELKKIDFENEVGYKISLPFAEIMKNPNSLFEGTKDELQQSEKYMTNLIYDNMGNIRPDGLLYCKTIEEIYNLVNEKHWVETPAMVNNVTINKRQEEFVIEHPGVRAKIFGILKEMYYSKIFDISSGTPSKWIVEVAGEKHGMYPWDACLFADVVPILICDKIRLHKYFSSYQRFIMEDIFNRQSNDDITKRNKLELWYFLDEIQNIIKKNPPSLETFRKINKEARVNRMGIVYTVQYLGDIPPDIKLTTDYVISFAQTSSEASEIARDFDLLKHQEKTLVRLPRYNCIIAGNELVTYDTEGRKEIIDDGTPFTGMIFPSVSQHSALKEEGI